MATLTPLLKKTEYKPIVSPPGGLLASAVGRPQNPLPPIDPKVYEDDDVVRQMDRITSQDSGYMQLARTQGLQAANKRGLLNSSMAVGASQAEAYRAAAPLAAQNAQQIAARNQERLASGFAGERQQVDVASREKMQGLDIENTRFLQGRDITSREGMQGRDIENTRYLQGREIEAQSTLQGRSLAAQERIANLNIQAESERLGRQLNAAEVQQQRDLASRSSLLGTELSSRETMAREGIVADYERAKLSEQGATSRANLDAATRTQLATMETMSREQLATLDYYSKNNQIYANSIDNLYGNKDLPAPARDQAMQLFLSLKNSGVNLPAAVLGRPLQWGPGTPAGIAPDANPGAFTPPPVNASLIPPQYPGPSRAEIDSLLGNKIDGDYDRAVDDYNRWAAANGVEPMVNRSSPGSGKSGGFLDSATKYSGINVAQKYSGAALLGKIF